MFALRQNSKLLRLNFIGKVRGPGLQEQLSRFCVENLLFGETGGRICRINRSWSLFGQQTSMERVLWQESLAEFTVTQPMVSILVKTAHKKGHFIESYLQTQLLQSPLQIVNGRTSRTLLIEEPKSVDQIEVCLEGQLYLGLLYFLLKFELTVQNVENVVVCRTQPLRKTLHVLLL